MTKRTREREIRRRRRKKRKMKKVTMEREVATVASYTSRAISALRCCFCFYLALPNLPLLLWLVRATVEAFRVVDAPAKVFFLLMKNTEEILPFCTQILQFQA
ncbi:uncharacterized protein DS421_12g362960 [Arachis hypogaea]|nr:uncharacterized protein DS421_12g362960 [Arachis hypogaea]